MRKLFVVLITLLVTLFAVSAQAAMYGTTIDFSSETIERYDPLTQDKDQYAYSVLDSGATLHLYGNTWKCVALDLVVAADSVLTFEYKSTIEGEVQGIGFDLNHGVDPEHAFQVFGTDYWSAGYHDFDDYTLADGWKKYTIDLTNYMSVGSHQWYLVFVNDDDGSGLPKGESYFRNVRVGGAITPVPGAVWLLGTGLLGLLGLRRRKRK